MKFFSYAGNYVNIVQPILNPIEDCSFHADCHDRDGDFYCECIVGFEGNGQECTDIDECIEGSSDRSGTKGRYDPNSSPNVCSGRSFKLYPTICYLRSHWPAPILKFI